MEKVQKRGENVGLHLQYLMAAGDDPVYIGPWVKASKVQKNYSVLWKAVLPFSSVVSWVEWDKNDKGQYVMTRELWDSLQDALKRWFLDM